MNTYAKRLTYAIELRNTTQSQLARDVGLKPQSIQYLCKTGTKSTHSVKIADALNINVRWLEEGNGIIEKNHLQEPYAKYQQKTNIIEWEHPDDLPNDQYAIIPRVLVKLSAGSGNITMEEELGSPLAFTTQWIKEKGINKTDLVCVNCTGDSMSPTLSDGALLLIDTSKKEVSDGKIYALRYGDELRVKRLFKRYDGGIIIRSDNQRKYPDEQLSPTDMNDHIYTIGLVIWQAGDVF